MATPMEEDRQPTQMATPMEEETQPTQMAAPIEEDKHCACGSMKPGSTMRVRFTVRAELESGEILHVVGSAPELGVWNPYTAQAFPQPQDQEGGNQNAMTDKKWTTTILMKAAGEFDYRYFVGRYLRDDKDSKNPMLVVVRWETNISPRHFVMSDKKKGEKNEATGTQTYLTGWEEFGHIDGLKHVSRGWLIGQTEIRIRMTPNSNPINMWKPKHRSQLYSIKCTAMDYRVKREIGDESSIFDNEEEDSREGPPVSASTQVHVVVLEEGRQIPRQQGQFGEVYQHKDYLEYRAQNFHPEFVGFMFDLYVHHGEDIPRHVGTAHLLPVDQKQTEGRLTVPLIGLNHKPIGEIHGDYLIIKPFPDYPIMQMHETFQSHWKSVGRSLDVGHRGMGSSYKQMSMAKENTLESLAYAGTHGADLVEFDVMLTKDKQVVIYHDFSVCLRYHTRQSLDSKAELFEIPVKDLTMNQLQSMKLSHASSMGGQNIELHGEQNDHHRSQPFPSLIQALEELDERLGFNIEVKYPMMDERGTWEMMHYFERNESIDRILDVVFQHAKGRKIIFSSFDPDSCVMLQKKQNRYPVLLLSCGQSTRYTPYMDYRARDFDPAIYFAQAEALLGVDMCAEGLLKDLGVIRRIKEAGLVLFVWGEECNSKANLDLLRKHGVDGLIYDRMEAYHPSVFQVDARSQLPLVELASHAQQEQLQAVSC